MTPGLRYHKSASLRIAIPMGLPDDMQTDVREIVGLHATQQGRGEATALLHSVCAEADREWKTLFIHVEPFDDGAMDAAKLTKWYSKFGFTVIQDAPCLMARSPERPRILR